MEDPCLSSHPKPVKSQLSSRANAFSIDALMACSKSRISETASEDLQSTQHHYGYLQPAPILITPLTCGTHVSAHDAPSSPATSSTVSPSHQAHRSRLTLDPCSSPPESGQGESSPSVEPVVVGEGDQRRVFTDEMSTVRCRLETRELWEKFHDLGTEMIITKTGRRMFPTVRVSFSGVSTEARYVVMLDIVSLDNKRYRYAYHRSSWLVAGKADPPLAARLYVHPDSPFTGDQLQRQMVSFEKVKLTNNEQDQHGHIILNSMHRYQPRVHIARKADAHAHVGATVPSLTTLDSSELRSFEFPETVFTAVTAYQNQLITRLKIDSNPFAKGFRDSSRLSDFERERVESLIQEHTYARSPIRPHDGGILGNGGRFDSSCGGAAMPPNFQEFSGSRNTFSACGEQFSLTTQEFSRRANTWGGVSLPPITPTALSLYPMYPMVSSSVQDISSIDLRSVRGSIHDERWFPVSHALRESHRYHKHLAQGPYASIKTTRSASTLLAPPSLVR